MKQEEMPDTALQRLPVYLNYLKNSGADREYISSGAIARALGMGEVLVRKDLARTSAHGKTRVGYRRTELMAAIEDYLGCNRVRPAVIVGAGGLGRALMSYGGFSNYGIEIVAAFDSDQKKAGTEVAGKPVYPVRMQREIIAANDVRLAVICVPAGSAQQVADSLVDCGIKAVLNFAPLSLKVPEGVALKHIDLAASLAILSSRI